MEKTTTKECTSSTTKEENYLFSREQLAELIERASLCSGRVRKVLRRFKKAGKRLEYTSRRAATARSTDLLNTGDIFYSCSINQHRYLAARAALNVAKNATETKLKPYIKNVRTF